MFQFSNELKAQNLQGTTVGLKAHLETRKQVKMFQFWLESKDVT